MTLAERDVEAPFTKPVAVTVSGNVPAAVVPLVVSVSRVLCPAVSVAAENAAVTPVGTPATVSIVKFVNPPLPVRPMLNAAFPTAGTPVTPGNAESWKSCVGITTKEPADVAGPNVVVTLIGPVVAFVGTVGTIEVSLATLNVLANDPLKVTAVTLMKFVPVIVI